MSITVRSRIFLSCIAVLSGLLWIMPVQSQQDPADEVVTAIVDYVVETTIKANRERLVRAMEAPSPAPADQPPDTNQRLPWLSPEEQRQRARVLESEKELELRELEEERRREIAELWSEYRREAAEGNRAKNYEKLQRKLEQKNRFFDQKREWLLNKKQNRGAD